MALEMRSVVVCYEREEHMDDRGYRIMAALNMTGELTGRGGGVMAVITLCHGIVGKGGGGKGEW